MQRSPARRQARGGAILPLCLAEAAGLHHRLGKTETGIGPIGPARDRGLEEALRRLKFVPGEQGRSSPLERDRGGWRKADRLTIGAGRGFPVSGQRKHVAAEGGAARAVAFDIEQPKGIAALPQPGISQGEIAAVTAEQTPEFRPCKQRPIEPLERRDRAIGAAEIELAKAGGEVGQRIHQGICRVRLQQGAPGRLMIVAVRLGFSQEGSAAGALAGAVKRGELRPILGQAVFRCECAVEGPPVCRELSNAAAEGAACGDRRLVVCSRIHQRGMSVPILRIEREREPGLLLGFCGAAEPCKSFGPEARNGRSLAIVPRPAEGARGEIGGGGSSACLLELSEIGDRMSGAVDMFRGARGEKREIAGSAGEASRLDPVAADGQAERSVLRPDDASADMAVVAEQAAEAGERRGSIALDDDLFTGTPAPCIGGFAKAAQFVGDAPRERLPACAGGSEQFGDVESIDHEPVRSRRRDSRDEEQQGDQQDEAEQGDAERDPDLGPGNPQPVSLKLGLGKTPLSAGKRRLPDDQQTGRIFALCSNVLLRSRRILLLESAGK